MSEPVLRAHSVSRAFASGSDTIHVLRGLDLDLAEGEAVAVVGSSGVGKSTLLHGLAGLAGDDPLGLEQQLQKIALFVEDRDRIGVILGSGIGGLSKIEQQDEVLRTRGPRRVTPHFVPMIMLNALAGQVSIRYGLRGPCFATVSACASSSPPTSQ